MLSFVQNFFAPRVNPIGVDFGTDCLRLAQVQYVGNDYRLVAAASCDVPAHVRSTPQARFAFFVEALRDLVAQGQFRSRQAVLALPASMMHIQHLRLAKMDEAETKKAIPWEARGKIPIDPTQALIRHLIAGEVYQDQEPRNEVIVMAAAREMVTQLLDSAAKAKLDVIGMNVEPKALADCFAHVYRRKTDAESTTCFLDIGSSATRAIVARGSQIFFARSIPIGGDHFSKTAALALRISFEEAKLLRIKLCHAQPTAEELRARPSPAAPSAAPVAASEENSFALLGAAVPQAQDRRTTDGPGDPLDNGHAVATVAAPEAPADPAEFAPARPDQAALVEQACREPLRKLIEELDLCRRYYESTFPSKPVDRLVFVGGEARHRALCQNIARELGLAAQLGDPLVRMGRTSEIGIESGIDRRQPQPGWSVAIGLSLGPVGMPVQKRQEI
jgi:type IV pilus assembly protein PilM